MQHCLRNLLPLARWTLCSITYAVNFQSVVTPQQYGIQQHYETIHINGYADDLDTYCLGEVAFKLTPETINDLLGINKAMWFLNPEELSTALKAFIYMTDANVLYNLDSEGTGELDANEAEIVKTQIMGILPALHPATLVGHWQMSTADCVYLNPYASETLRSVMNCLSCRLADPSMCRHIMET